MYGTSLGLLKSFLSMHLSYMGPVSWVSVLVVGSGGNLMVAGEWALFFLCTLGAQKLIFGGSESLIAVISLFIDMAENTLFLTSKLPATCVFLALISHPISPSPMILPFSLFLAHQPFHASVPLLTLVMSRDWGCLNPLAKSYPS